MLAVSAAFPLTSDQPPVAVAPVTQLMRFLPGGAGAAQTRLTIPTGLAPERSQGAQAVGDPQAAPPLPPTRDPYAISGPPPAFEANVLDIERRFEAVLARIELARAQRELRLGSAEGRDAATAFRAAAEPPPGRLPERRWAPDQPEAASEGTGADQAQSPPPEGAPVRTAEIIRFSPMQASWRSRMTTAEPDLPPLLARAV